MRKLVFTVFFFFSSRRRHTRWNCDWSSDVCSSDLVGSLADGRHVRMALIPFQQATEPRVLAVAIPTSRFGSTLENFGSVALVVFPLSLLLTAGISMFYVGRSLAPIAALTNHAAL